MPVDEIILQKLNELHVEMKDFKKDFDEHKSSVEQSNREIVKMRADLDHTNEEYQRHRTEQIVDIDRLWENSRQCSKGIIELIKETKKEAVNLAHDKTRLWFAGLFLIIIIKEIVNKVVLK